MKRRIFSVLLSSALLLTALAGCGQGGEAAPSGSSSDADSETGTRDELIFVNYRDIRDLNPHLYAGEMYAQSNRLCAGPGASALAAGLLADRALWRNAVKGITNCYGVP